MEESGSAETHKVTNFREIASESQRLWRQAKKEPHKAFSQAIELPESLGGKITKSIIDNLPQYIPDDVIREIEESHPSPLLTAGVLVDKRVFRGQGIDQQVIYPEGLQLEEDKEDWGRGMVLLDEIATDTLAGEVLKRMSTKGRVKDLDKYLASLARLSHKFIGKGYEKGLAQAEQALGGKESFEIFRKALVIAMLTGKHTEVDRIVTQYGYDDMDRFALDIGRQNKYSTREIDFFQKLGGEEFARSLGGNTVPWQYPGVINLSLLHALVIPATFFASNKAVEIMSNRPAASVDYLGMLAMGGAWSLVYEGSTMTDTVVHEACHYLGNNIDHRGLFPTKYV